MAGSLCFLASSASGFCVCLRMVSSLRSNASWSLVCGPARDDRLADQRHAVQHGLAQAGGIGRHIAPAQQLLAFDLDEMLELLDHDLARLGFARQEAHGHGILAGRRQRDAGLLGPFAEQRIGNLDQDAGAVAHQRIGAHRAAMIQIDEKLQALADDLMGLGALDVGDKADAARVMLVARVVKTLFRRQTHQTPTPTTVRSGRLSPPSRRESQENARSSELPVCEHAASCGAT